jgi:hypothetical protein
MNKILLFISITALLSGCGGGNKYQNYAKLYGTPAPSVPTDVQESFLASTSLYGSDDGGPAANIAVLLPSSGVAKTTGNDIKTSIETALLRKPKTNIKMSFYDLSGDVNQKYETMRQVLYTSPDVIIGPLFAEDAKILRDIKSAYLPVISFTSDTQSLGDGVMTVNLIPTQSIEAIVRQIKSETNKGMIIFAPNDKSGKVMASVADTASDFYEVPIHGVFYYDSGNSDSIKDATIRASLYNTRKSVNDRAREILSDILVNEELTPQAKKSLSYQLEKISRTETLGDLPYDTILFLGNGDDSKTIASFLRYYGVNNRDAAFYGTTLWHNSDITSDFTMTGAKYATLPEISNNFASLYNMVAGKDPDYLSAFGYDAANLALGMIYSQKSGPAYFFDPSGYIGTTGVFRIQPDGIPERALRIVELDGSKTPKTIKDAPTNFLVPIYNIQTSKLNNVPEISLSTYGIDPGDYIRIPENLRNNPAYKTKIIGGNQKTTKSEPDKTDPIPVYIAENKDSETVSNPEFEPVKLESISRKYIDNIEIEE